MTTRIRQAAKNRGAARGSRKAGVRYDERAKVYVAYAPALNIYSQATSEEHARRALEGAITLVLGVVSDGRSAGVRTAAGPSKARRKHRMDG